MEHDTAGDPVSGIKWTRRTTEKIADELQRRGHRRMRQHRRHTCSNSSASGCGSTTRSSPTAATQAETTSSPTSPPSGNTSPPMAGPSSASTPNTGSWSATSPTTGHLDPTAHRVNDLRLPLRSRRYRHSLRHLRHPSQPRVGVRRHLPRHPRLRGRQPRQMVALRRPTPLPRRHQLLVLADGGGSNGSQKPGLETRSTAPTLRPSRSHRHRLPLSPRLEMEPNGAPAIQRDQQELGRPAPRQLPNHPQLPPHHHNHNRPPSQGLPRHQPTTPQASRPPTSRWTSYNIRPHDTQPARNYTLTPPMKGQYRKRKLFLRRS